MSPSLSPSYRRWLWIALLSILAVRLLTLNAYPFQDTTEARYGEMARLMVETQNWVTPQFDYDIPFWGKPPLATWLSAGAYQLFGVTEFAGRLPSLALALAILGLVYFLGQQRRSPDLGLVAATMLASSMMFFVAAGAVIMDTALVTGITLSMVAFWQAINSAKRAWGYAFFIGLSIGLMSKGPLTLVLVLVPIGAWALWHRKLSQTWQRIPWLSGGMLMLMLTLPWYILAELRTPGFIDYFIIGEHWKRFTVSGWQGDLYGSAHAEARGTIWLYAIAAFLPWSLLLPALIRYKNPTGVTRRILDAHPWATYMGLWAVTPLLFFTFAGNILATYTLPALIPLSLLGADVWLSACSASTAHNDRCHMGLKILPYLGLTTPLLLLGLIYLQASGYIGTTSQRDLLAAYQQQRSDRHSRIIYLIKRPFSGQFYSRGQAREAKNWQQAQAYLDDNIQDFYALKSKHQSLLPDNWQHGLRIVGNFHGYLLLQEVAESPHSDE